MNGAQDERARDTSLRVVQRLLSASATDSVYRDVYLERAREVMVAVLPFEGFRSLVAEGERAKTLLKRSRFAVQRGSWKEVQRLSLEAEALRRHLAPRAAEIGLGRAVYEPPLAVVDPFSPGAETVLPGSATEPERTRSQAVDALAQLVRSDPSNAAFYVRRREYLSSLKLVAPVSSGRAVTIDPLALEREAMRAAEQGEPDRLLEIAESMLAREGKVAADGRKPPAVLQAEADLLRHFDAATVARAAKLGLAAVELEPMRPGYEKVAEFMYANAWHPSLDGVASEEDGMMRLRDLVENLEIAPELRGPLEELAALFIRHPYVNSGGGRYLPKFGRETMLIEDFPEGDDEPQSGALLEALGLPRRSALAREAIEDALIARGTGVLRERLGLNPLDYKLVCVPFDAYSRLGRDRGWGRRERHWTHFDGYQVMRGPTFRSLCGGDARYGGLVDLVSISPSDERPTVRVRFAVVQRARLVARWT